MRPRRKTIRAERRIVRNQDRLTDELLQQIVRSRAPESFLGLGSDVPHDLAGYLARLLEEKGLKKSQVIKTANLNETFGYQIFSGQRGASRNKVLALALAMGADLHETRLLLMHADLGDLYCKNRRDAIIIYCISHGYDLIRTDEELYRFGEETVSDDPDSR